MHHNQAPVSVARTTEPRAEGLVIGTQGIAPKDVAVLKALVRLFEGGINVRARFSEQLQECNVVLVPGNWPGRMQAPCIAVRVIDSEHPDVAPHAKDDLVVAAPLRMSNVIAVLQSATQRVHCKRKYDAVQGLLSLFALLSESLRRGERRRAVVPLSSGQQIVFDFTRQLVHTAMPMEVVLSGAYTLGTPHRVSPVEEELIRAVPTHSLRNLLWHMGLRLGEANAPAPARSGRYRLLRWPDAVGLAAPGHPRLAALWTDRPRSLVQMDAVSGMPAATVRWFLEVSLALGLAVPEAGESAAGEAATPVDEHAAEPPSPPRTAAPGWLGSLRERLKLW